MGEGSVLGRPHRVLLGYFSDTCFLAFMVGALDWISGGLAILHEY